MRRIALLEDRLYDIVARIRFLPSECQIKKSTTAKSQGVPSPQESEASDPEDELQRLKIQQQEHGTGIQALIRQQEENGDCIRELMQRTNATDEKFSATASKLDEILDMLRRKSTTPSRTSSPVPTQQPPLTTRLDPLTPKRELSEEPVYIERAKYVQDKQPVFNVLEFQEDTSSMKDAYVGLYKALTKHFEHIHVA